MSTQGAAERQQDDTIRTMASAAAASAKPDTDKKNSNGQNYKGFVGGVFSGIAKLTGEALYIAPGLGLTITDKIYKWAIPSTRLRSGSKPPQRVNSTAHSNVSSKRSRKKA
jgi:hypothetical protein